MQQAVPCSSCHFPQLLPESVSAEILSTRKRRKLVDPQCKEVLLHILEKCKTECQRKELLAHLDTPHNRTVLYAGVSITTIGRIKAADRKRKESGNAKQPFMKLRRARSYKSVLDDRDVILIKNLIRDYYIKYCRVPAVQELMPTILDEIPTYRHKQNFLNNVLRNIGYKRKRHYSTQYVLMEDFEIMSYRNSYLKTIRDLRNQTDNIFYVYECVIDRSFTFHKSFVQKYGYNEALRNKDTFMYICAASVNGFLGKSALLQRTVINPVELGINAATFEHWLKVNLIPNLPENSIVIMENAPHHCIPRDKVLSYYSNKSEMFEYLRAKNVQCTENMRRTELYKLVEQNTPKRKVYVVNDILEESKHKGLFLPPYMIDLSPTQHAMDKIQLKLFESAPESDFILEHVLEILEDAVLSLTKEDWTECFEKVNLVEEDCWKKDGEFEIAIDKVLLNLRNCVENGSEESDFDSDVECSDKSD